MFKSKPTSTEIGLNDTILELVKEMHNVTGDDPAYAKMTDQLVKLYALKEVDTKVNAGKRISPDTMAIVGANVLGILMIVGHERANVITSKALTLLTKLR